MTTTTHNTSFIDSKRIFVSAKKKEDRLNNNTAATAKNKSTKLFYSSSLKNMYEALEKSAPIFPSFLTLEPIPEFKIFDSKTSFSSKPISIELQKPKAKSGKKLDSDTDPGNVSSTRNNFVDNCDSSGSSFDGLMPPPPPANLVKMSDSFKSKAAKKKPPSSSPLSGALSQKPAKLKRFSCTDCDLGVTFKSKIELQHHQSGNCLLCRSNKIVV